jgi:hypothetical protein
MKSLKNNSTLFSFLGSLTLVYLCTFSYASAASVPSLSLSLINNNTQVQMAVIGADPNATVLFYYPSSSSIISANLGNTNTSGYLTATINPATYNIAIGAPTYVIVDGVQSQSISWPSYSTQTTSSGYISLSQANVNLTAGQATTITISSNVNNPGTFSIPGNTNPSIASTVISGNQIVLNGLIPGSTNMTVCATNAGCTTLYVYVNVQQASVSQSNTASSSVTTSTIYFSQSTVTIPVGGSQSITLSGPGSFYITSNPNPSVASAIVNGSVLTINGLTLGMTTLDVCSSGNNVVTCGAVNVSVSGSESVTNTSTASTTVYVNPDNLNISIGQTTNVTLTSSQYVGSILYYVNSNPNPSAVTVNINGSTAQVTGLAYGGSNISICEVGGDNCANLYVYVNPSSTPGSTVQTNNSVPLALTSFSISSNNVNNTFMSSRDALTLTFTANQNISNPKVMINGSQITVYGSGNGPYTAIYTLTGNETLPLPIAINFSNPAGSAGQVDFWVGNNAVAPATAAASTIVSSQTNNGNVSTTGYTFTQYLYDGSTGSQVTALQERLTTDGIYSGPITGTFGPLTKAAVKAYQAKHSLDQLGVVGPATRALLNQGI